MAFPNSLFWDLFLGFWLPFHFSKKHLWMKSLFQSTISRDLSHLCQWDHKNIRNLMWSSRTISLYSFKDSSHRKPAVWQIEHHTRNPSHRAWLFLQSLASQVSPHGVRQIYVTWRWPGLGFGEMGGLLTHRQPRTTIHGRSLLVLRHSSEPNWRTTRVILLFTHRTNVPNWPPT